ncbi:hypothetical protein LP52_15455 [Streptomonospora alba]|uniref:Uncharacterized protein n=1 Tax=Streptomonospora alba TaxID=183763 RepID=A0A0C2FFR5_9ACTN|nr:hypothetical protein LP52_15455 [Streptomonospora alba]
MQCSYRDGNLALDSDYWIVGDSSYIMLDLPGEHPDGAPERLEGGLDSSGRHGFSVEKISDEAQPPPV